MIAAQKPRTREIEPPAPGKNSDRRQCRGQRAGEAGRERVFPKDPVARDLTPIGERRFVEAIAIIEIGHDIIAALDHLARSLGKTRLVAVDQGQHPAAGEMKKQAAAEEREKIAGCRLQETDSKMAQAERQPANFFDAQNRAGLEMAPARPARDRRDRGRLPFRPARAPMGAGTFQPHREAIHAQRQPLRRLARARRCRAAPDRARLVAREQTLGAHRPNDDPGLRPRRPGRARPQALHRPRPALGETGTRLELGPASARNTIPFPAVIRPRQAHFSACFASLIAASA